MLTLAELNILANQLTKVCSGEIIHKVFIPDKHSVVPEILNNAKVLLCECIGKNLVFALDKGYLYLSPGLSRISFSPSLRHSLMLFSMDLGPKGIVYAEGTGDGFFLRTEVSPPGKLKSISMERKDRAILDRLDWIPEIDYGTTDDVLFDLGIHPMALISDIQEPGSIAKTITKHLKERESLGGTEDFLDLFGHSGKYKFKIYKKDKCPNCKEKVSTFFVNRRVYFCELCQKIKRNLS